MLARGAPFLSSGPTNIKYLVAGNPDILDLILMFAADVNKTLAASRIGPVTFSIAREAC